MKLWIVSDGKPGHLNQSLGLADALRRCCGSCVEHEIIDIAGTPWWQNWLTARSYDSGVRPDVIIGAGHATHVPVYLMAKKWKALSVVCMKPSLPKSLFGMAVIPYHDLIAPTDLQTPDALSSFMKRMSKLPGIIPTMGAMHRIIPSPDTPKTENLILVGGLSKAFDWDENSLIDQLRLIEKSSELPLCLTTSRRTPPTTVNAIRHALPNINVVPVEDTDPTWVARHLAQAREVWVTEDSVSMIFESLGSGARVGLLSVPCKDRENRLLLGIDLLVKSHYVVPFPVWKETAWEGLNPSELAESDRVARVILEKYPSLSDS